MDSLDQIIRNRQVILISEGVMADFGQNLLTTALELRKLQENRRQFNEDLAYRNRQLGLLDLFRNKEFEVQQQQQANELRAPKIFSEGYVVPGQTPTFYPYPNKPTQTSKPEASLLGSKVINGESTDVYGYYSEGGKGSVALSKRFGLEPNEKGIYPTITNVKRDQLPGSKTNKTEPIIEDDLAKIDNYIDTYSNTERIEGQIEVDGKFVNPNTLKIKALSGVDKLFKGLNISRDDIKMLKSKSGLKPNDNNNTRRDKMIAKITDLLDRKQITTEEAEALVRYAKASNL